MTVDELGHRMSSAEFTEWLAYYSVSPFGDERADLRMAILADTMARVNGAKGTSVKQFMPSFGPKLIRKPWQSIRSAVRKAIKGAADDH